MMNIPRIISRYAHEYKSRIAIVSGEQSWTFAEVHERSNRLANGLRDLGVGKGDRVATLISNSPRYQEIEFALSKIAAVRVALNLRLSLEELIWQINDIEPKTLIMEEEGLSKIASIRPKITIVKDLVCFGGSQENVIDYEELISKSSPNELDIDAADEDIWTINYTSGTTGMPKGIVIPFRSNTAIFRNMLLDMVPHLAATDLYMSLQPLFPAGGSFILPCWARGATHVIVPRFDPEMAFYAIEKWRVTLIKTVPTVLQRLVDSPDIKNKDLSSIHTIVYGGSPIAVEKLKKAIEIFGPVFVGNYGLTEAPQTDLVLSREDHKDSRKLGSAGKPYTMVEAKIVDENDQEVAVGEMGELIVRGDHIMHGYWKRPPEATGETLRNGWIHTRDMARKDEDGYFYLVDRKSEMIISGGYNIYPNEVEQVIYQHPDVSEVAVVGVPDDQWGEAVKAVVCLKEGARVSEQELIDFCKERLSSYKKPKSIDFVNTLPKNAVGKVLRREVRESYWKGHDRRIH
jgi:acyl-CoA synthetase (AMP-forming)/AMP-acid ligase II